MASKSLSVNGIDYKIGYEIVNPAQEKTALFLHGWGADRAMMKRAFGGHFDGFRLVFVDLPGFGASSISKPMDSYGYKEVVSEFLKTLNIKPSFIAGHSFGGKIATLLKPGTLVLLSSAGVRVKKSLKIKAKIKTFKLLKALGFGRFYRLFASRDVDGMSEAMYESFKKVVDEDISDEFSAFEGKALLFWGKEDTATPLNSGEKIHHLIKNSSFYPLEGDHFFFLHQGKSISDTIKENL